LVLRRVETGFWKTDNTSLRVKLKIHSHYGSRKVATKDQIPTDDSDDWIFPVSDFYLPARQSQKASKLHTIKNSCEYEQKLLAIPIINL